MADEFEINDSGERAAFAGGMVRDTATGKTNFLSVRFGPMFKRWAVHCTNGRNKYPDPEPGVPNWTLAEGREEQLRFQESAARHFEAWLAGERDEDHAAGVFFNINGAEYVRDKLEDRPNMDDIEDFLAGIKVMECPALNPDTVLLADTGFFGRWLGGRS